MVRNTGKHAAGIIITDTPLEEYVPLTLQEGDVTVQYDMNAVAKLGLLKMDFLGLKTLTVIADAVENVRRTADPAFDLEQIPLDDAKTFALLNSGRTTGVFQLESGGMQALCRQLQVSTIDEIIALIALYRPGPMEWIPDYIRGKKDPATVKFPHPLLEEVCHETYGVMVYQEQVMEAAKVIAGYTLGGADMLRRAMGKKDPVAMARGARQVRRRREAAAQHRRGRLRRDLRHPQQIRRLRLQQIALRRLRHPQLPDGLPEGEPPGAVHGRRAQLRAGQRGKGRPFHRRGARHGHPRARPRRQRVPREFHAGGRRRRQSRSSRPQPLRRAGDVT